MKTKRYYIMPLALAFTVIGCSDDINSGIPQANTGDEVQFSTAHSGVNTRTVYGEETDTGFPIYWVSGDKVKVASPQCNIKQAEYQVSVESETQNYASTLTKTGDAGIQWGAAETADFYSIYPSENVTFDVNDESNVSATLSINQTQSCIISEKTDENGNSYFCAQPKDMSDVIMYAYASQQPKSADAVNLQYTPFSTVIEFEITAPEYNAANTQNFINLQTLTLTAPEGTKISGSFTLNFDKENTSPTVSNNEGNNEIIMHFYDSNNTYSYQLSTNGKRYIKAKICLIPISGMTSLNNWKVKVTAGNKDFIKTLKDEEKNTGELKPGMVHKIKLPELQYGSKQWDYELDSWITSLPNYTNIYLSEISLPGAWYAGSPATENYQATQSIATMWDNGVRAFSVECRSCTTSLLSNDPSRVCVSGTGSNSIINDGYKSNNNTIYISTIIQDIANSIHKDEYGILILSYADGGKGGHRDIDHNYFIYGIANEITQAGIMNIHNSKITSNTTINDVLGKLIIKINVDEKILKNEYSNNMNALFSYTPFQSQLETTYYYFSNMYWQNWDDSYKEYSSSSSSSSELQCCFNYSKLKQLDTNTDSTIPTYEARKNILKKMMNRSKQIYDSSNHNIWFYFNAGGTEATSSTSDSPSPTNFATNMNSWLLELINTKSYASPLGLVIFNQCTNDVYMGPDIIKAIIEMNSKFYLKHINDGSNTGGNTDSSVQSSVQSAAPGYNSGMVDNNTDAFE